MFYSLIQSNIFSLNSFSDFQINTQQVMSPHVCGRPSPTQKWLTMSQQKFKNSHFVFFGSVNLSPLNTKRITLPGFFWGDWKFQSLLPNEKKKVCYRMMEVCFWPDWSCRLIAFQKKFQSCFRANEKIINCLL